MLLQQGVSLSPIFYLTLDKSPSKPRSWWQINAMPERNDPAFTESFYVSLGLNSGCSGIWRSVKLKPHYEVLQTHISHQKCP